MCTSSLIGWPTKTLISQVFYYFNTIFFSLVPRAPQLGSYIFSQRWFESNVLFSLFMNDCHANARDVFTLHFAFNSMRITVGILVVN